MNARGLLAECRRLGVTLTPEPGGLRCRPRAALTDALRAAIIGHKVELLILLAPSTTTGANSGPDVPWREAAMRAQLAQVEVGGNIPALRARPGPFPFRACRECGRAGWLFADTCDACGGGVLALCNSCGESTRFAGGRCDPCFAAALRVVPMDMVVKPTKGRVSEDILRRLKGEEPSA